MNLATLPDAPAIPAYHVVVQFGRAIPSADQGKALLAMERHLREVLGVPAEVYKDSMADDLKRRRDMTPDQRAGL